MFLFYQNVVKHKCKTYWAIRICPIPQMRWLNGIDIPASLPCALESFRMNWKNKETKLFARRVRLFSWRTSVWNRLREKWCSSRKKTKKEKFLADEKATVLCCGRMQCNRLWDRWLLKIKKEMQNGLLWTS